MSGETNTERTSLDRSATLFQESRDSIYRRADRLFANLMVVQWLAAIAAALWISPKTWIGASSQTHWHVWAAIFLGGAITGFPVFLAWKQPGRTLTRHTIAVAQMLTSALLVHLTGGRVETHFHVFGSLAFLAFYRDWRVLLTATVVVAGDHMARGLFWPQSVFGVLTASPWRWLEHAGWVLFEDTFLFISIRQGIREMSEVATRRAKLEGINAEIERQVIERTAALAEAEKKYRSIFENAAEGIYQTLPDGRYLTVNPQLARIYGYSSPAELMSGVTNIEGQLYVDSQRRSEFMSLLAENNFEFVIKNFESQIYRKDGSIIWISEGARTVLDDNGALLYFEGTVEDITERKQAEAFLNSVLQNLPITIFIKEAKDLRFVMWNKGGEELTGYRNAEMVGKNDYDFFPKEQADYFVAKDRETLAGGKLVDVEEEEMLTRHRGTRIVHTRKIPIFDEAGRPLYLLGIAEDITERKRAETQRDRLADIVEASQDLIGFADPKTTQIQYVNRHGRRMCGIGEDEDIGKLKIGDVHPAWMNKLFAEVILPAAVRDGFWEGEGAFLHRNGREIPVLMTLVARKAANGEVDIFYTIARDITARKLAEEKLNESLRSLATVNAVMDRSCIIATTDQRGAITHANDNFCKISEYSREELLGQNHRLLNSRHHPDSFFTEMWRTIANGEVWRGEVKNRTKNDGTYWVDTTIGPMLDVQGKPKGYFAIRTDITARKLHEERLAELNKQLVETSRRAGMAEVATGVLHNVGNVLNSVNVSSSLVAQKLKRSKVANLAKVVAMLRAHEADLGTFLTADPKGKQLPAYLAELSAHVADEQATALDELVQLQKNIDHIKDIVAMQQGFAKVSGVTETVQVSDLVEDALRMNSSSLTRHDIHIIKEFGDVPAITTEKQKVLQILVNLVSNAKHACRDGGGQQHKLTIRVRHANERVCIAVSDNGVGIPPENLTRIFSHGFTTKKDGHGFGLHSGALAAKELGGSLSAHSEGPGRGATFTVELPLNGAGISNN